MNTGDIILIPFPFSELKNVKVRPSVVICETKDKYRDLVVSAISSVLSQKLSQNEIIIRSNNINNLRKDSTIKVDRIVTVKSNKIIAKLGKLDVYILKLFKQKFKNLID